MVIGGRNRLLSWIGRTMDLSAVTSQRHAISVQPSLSTDPWNFERFYAQWFSTEDDPSAFSQVSWQIQFPQRHHDISEMFLPLRVTTNPGPHDRTAPVTPNRPKTYFFKSPRIDFLMPSQTTFAFIVENFLGTGKPDTIDLLFVGEKVTKRVY